MMLIIVTVTRLPYIATANNLSFTVNEASAARNQDARTTRAR